MHHQFQRKSNIVDLLSIPISREITYAGLKVGFSKGADAK